MKSVYHPTSSSSTLPSFSSTTISTTTTNTTSSQTAIKITITITSTIKTQEYEDAYEYGQQKQKSNYHTIISITPIVVF